MIYEDKKLTCRDCQKEFVWTAGEQEFFAQKGFDKPPIRCTDCRKKKKDRQQKPEAAPVENTGAIYEITCSKCSKKTEVSFQPRNPKDILCSSCFLEKFNDK